MGSKMYALVGSWHYIPGPRGYSVYSYDPETARMEIIETAFPDLAAGQQAIDEEKGIAYVVNEIGSLRGRTGGGGYVLAIRVDPATGLLSVVNEKESLSPAPSYFFLDKSRKYGVVVHHAGFGFVTRITRGSDGAYSSETLFDDTAIVLFRIRDDGSIGEACDVAVKKGDGPSGPHTISHLHSVVSDPSGELLFVCDKGLDRIYTYRIDRENGKLVALGEVQVEDGSFPRYGVAHPRLPLFYSNNEKTPDIFSFSYDVRSGVMTRVGKTSVQPRERVGSPSEPSDITIHPSGNHLYVSDRGSDTISVFAVDGRGGLELVQCVECGGKNPRGLCLSPDARFLIVANSDTSNLSTFRLRDDGGLERHGPAVGAVCPANVRIMRF